MHLVLLDHDGTYADGALVPDEVARQINDRSGCTIPVEHDLFGINAVSGFMERRWGRGLALSPAIPKRLSPMVLLVHGAYKSLNWRARIQATGPEQATGYIRLVGDTSQVNTVAMGIHPAEEGVVEFSKLPERDQAGGWCVGGRLDYRNHMGGYQGLSIYGAGTGAFIVWSAVSQSDQDI